MNWLNWLNCEKWLKCQKRRLFNHFNPFQPIQPIQPKCKKATLDDMRKLSTKQRAAIAALLEGQTQQGAASAAGVTKRQVQRWLLQPAFTAELRAGSDGAIRAASARLAALAEHAVNAIFAAMTQPEARGAGVRLRAGEALLNHARQYKEHADILERLAQLEKMLDEQSR